MKLPILIALLLVLAVTNAYRANSIRHSLVVPRFCTRAMKDSIHYRGAVLWNTVTYGDNDIATLNYKKLNDILSSSIIFKDYDFNVTSASTARSRDVNYFCI